MLCVIQYFIKSLKVIRSDTVEWGMCNILSVSHCNYVCILYCFWDTEHQTMAWPWNLGYISLKVTEYGITWKLGYGLLFALHSNYGSVLYHFPDKSRQWKNIATFSYSMHLMPIKGVHVRVLPYHLLQKN